VRRRGRGRSPCRAGWGTCLEDGVAFGVKDESAHIGDGRAAAGQEHAEDQADVGFGALDQVDEDLSALDLPEGGPVSEKRPLNVAVDLDGIVGGVVQDLDGLDAAEGRAMRRSPKCGAPSHATLGLRCRLPVPLGSSEARRSPETPG
jgi:hypothetical protein